MVQSRWVSKAAICVLQVMRKVIGSLHLPAAGILRWLDEHVQIRLSILLTYLFSKSVFFVELLRWLGAMGRYMRMLLQPAADVLGAAATHNRNNLKRAWDGTRGPICKLHGQFCARPNHTASHCALCLWRCCAHPRPAFPAPHQKHYLLELCRPAIPECESAGAVLLLGPMDKRRRLSLGARPDHSGAVV